MTIHYGPSGSVSATQGTWKSIGDWYEPLVKDRLVSTPEIAAKAKELVGDETDFYEKAEAIAGFLQSQIRYFAIEMDIGGFQPHFAGDIFRNRYSDCKDKATLLSAGTPALTWRHSALSGDDASLRRELRTAVERMLPGGMDVLVTSIEKLQEYEQPLVVRFTVKGPVGSLAGKRLLVPGDIFLANSRSTFPHEKREIAVDFGYPYWTQDGVRITFPPSIKVESSPAADKFQFQNFAAYNLSSTSTPTSITMRRDFLLGEPLFLAKEYPELRAFYNRFETKDQESIVLTAAPPAAAKVATGN